MRRTRTDRPVGCVNSIACAKTADLQAEPTLRTPHEARSRSESRTCASRGWFCVAKVSVTASPRGASFESGWLPSLPRIWHSTGAVSVNDRDSCPYYLCAPRARS
jgi:hypothetical protein